MSVLDSFHPAVAAWFSRAFEAPTPAQVEAWPAIQRGRNVLVAAPTGSGKTFAAFLAAIDELVREGIQTPLPNETRVVYVSPLKALSNDIQRNLEAPLAGIRDELRLLDIQDVEIRAAVRTGDTPQADRTSMRKYPPHILVTTPESLYILLSSESGRKMLATTRSVIVDEIHAIAGNKRGAHLALSLERLTTLCGGKLTRIGLSATQKPIDEVARFLVGGAIATAPLDAQRDCVIVDSGHVRKRDLALEVPPAPLEAVMSGEVWSQVYDRLAELIRDHRTTLIFVNTRRLAERAARQLSERIGIEHVTAHHGSLAKEQRFNAEQRLKRGELKALVATASLELGIDIGDVDLVCQLSTPRSINAFLQRVGRAGHAVGGTSKGRLFPLSRDDLVECTALLDCVRRGELDRLKVPDSPLDVLAQQIAAEVAGQEWNEDEMFDFVRRAYPYRQLTRESFDEIVKMLAEGFSTKRGRHGALIHHDTVNRMLRPRRGTRLTAITSGSAIPDTADFQVMLEPEGQLVGTVNEDFAVESLAGDVFQLGNTSYRILRVERSTVRVEDAKGMPPSIPFWLGEAPGRTNELSVAVTRVRQEVEQHLPNGIEATVKELMHTIGIDAVSASQLVEYLAAARAALGALPTQDTIIFERFFDEAGGMQLIVHSPFGSRVNRAWGLALRKRFCRKFNFELQAAATEDSLILSLTTAHSFDLEDAARYLHSNSVREILIQALCAAPMFATRWRWAASIALALPRFRGGKKVPPPLVRMNAEDLLASVFPDQVACAENLTGELEIPDHPLVRQAIRDCLEEAMDIDRLEQVLKRMEAGEIRVIARDLMEPSPLALEVLTARPYAYLDDAPLEERRTQAVMSRRWVDPQSASDMGKLDMQAIERVREEAFPDAVTADELHDGLLWLNFVTDEEVARNPKWPALMADLVSQARVQSASIGARDADGGLSNGPHTGHAIASAAHTSTAFADGALSEGPHTGHAIASAAHPSTAFADVTLSSAWPSHAIANAASAQADAAQGLGTRSGRRLWFAVERRRLFAPLFADVTADGAEPLTRDAAILEIIRGRLEGLGPVTAVALADSLAVPVSSIDTALAALQAEGFAMRGRFTPDATDVEWCDRRLLARIHRYTVKRLRAEIEPVQARDFQRFLFEWQRVLPEARMQGPDALSAILTQLEGFEAPAGAWETEVLPARISEYEPEWLDEHCRSGRFVWTRLASRNADPERGAAPVRATPIALLARRNVRLWSAFARRPEPQHLTAYARAVVECIQAQGASFFDEIVDVTRLFPMQVEEALGELVALGVVSSDSFGGLRALLVPADRRKSATSSRRKRRIAFFGMADAGRWTLTHRNIPSNASVPTLDGSELVEHVVRTLLRRWGVIFWKLLARESDWLPPWRELIMCCRRLEARGEIRGGRFVAGFSGEQYATPEAIGLLREVRRKPHSLQDVALSAADPLNLVGILTPGARLSSLTGNRVLYRDGIPLALLAGGEVRFLETLDAKSEWDARNALLRRHVPAILSDLA